MPNYIYLNGDCSHLASTRVGFFTLKDRNGREWVCYETEGYDATGGPTVLELKDESTRLVAQGIPVKAVRMRNIECADREQLRCELTDRSLPIVE
jgi:hypothetical protein